MAQQIIITKDNYGIDLSCVFLDSKKKPIDITGMNVEVVITNPNDVIIDTVQATIINPIGGYSSIVINNEHTNIVGLYKTFWTLLDSDGRVTAQEDVYYYVKDKNGGSGDYSSESTFDIESVREKFNELDSSIVTIEGNVDTLKSNVSNINSNIALLDTKINTTNLNVSGLDTRITKTETEIEEIKNINVNAEVVEARQGKVRLVDNIQEIKTNLETTNEEISSLEFNKVDKVEGKQLSTNDFDNRLKQLVEDWNNFKSNGGEIGGNVISKGYVKTSENFYSTGTNDVGLMSDTSGVKYSSVSKILYPTLNDTVSLGNSSLRWKDVYLTGVSKSTNGYTKLPNGMIMQWGTVDMSIDQNSVVTQQVTLPVVYSNKILSCFANAMWNNTDNSSGWTDNLITQCSTIAKSNITIVVRNLSETSGFKTYKINWMTLGH